MRALLNRKKELDNYEEYLNEKEESINEKEEYIKQKKEEETNKKNQLFKVNKPDLPRSKRYLLHPSSFPTSTPTNSKNKNIKDRLYSQRDIDQYKSEIKQESTEFDKLNYWVEYFNNYYCKKYNMEEFYTKLHSMDDMRDIDLDIKNQRKQYPDREIKHPLDKSKEDIIEEVSYELGASGKFVPLSLEEAKKYDSIVDMICNIFNKIFNIPNLKLILISNSQKVNAMFANNLILDLLNEYEFSKNKSLEFNKWLQKQKFNKFTSDAMSIKFKNINHKKDTIIIISDLLILNTKSSYIIATLLHEIGHIFALHLLPSELGQNMSVQERFADAFCAKFGYGFELVQTLKHLVLTSLFNEFGRKIRAIINTKYNNNKDISTYKKANMDYLLDILMSRSKYPTTSDKRSAKYDEHPSDIHRFNDIISHLYIELGNQRISPLKKKELLQNINNIIKEIPRYNNNEYEQFIKNRNDLIYKTALAQYEIKKSNTYFNNYILRNLLDNIYDQTVGKV